MLWVWPSEEPWDHALGRLARVRWTHDLLACISDRVVSLVLGDLDALSSLASENVVAAITLVGDVLRAHHCSHLAVVVVVGQLLPILRLIVVQIQQVVRCAALILLSCIELVSFHGDDFGSTLVTLLHVFKPSDLAGEPLLA